MKTGKSVFMGVVAIAATLSILWFNNRTVAPQKSTLDGVVTEAQNGGYRLINTEELWQRYNADSESLFLVDTRQEWEYRTGHIKGASNFPMETTWWSRWRAKGSLRKFLGPNKDRFIVFY
jgi:3-mercaptopyruvate sulfurtransferase SseA